jgi:hypothetical protein
MREVGWVDWDGIAMVGHSNYEHWGHRGRQSGDEAIPRRIIEITITSTAVYIHSPRS